MVVSNTAVEVDGVWLPAGTSLYQRGRDRVMWLESVGERTVILETTDERFKVEVSVFKDRISDGTLQVEFRPRPTEHL